MSDTAPFRSVVDWIPSRAILLAIALAAASFLFFSGVLPVLAAGIIATDPITNEVGVDLDAGIVVTYTAAISPTTVTTRTFVAQGMMSGRRDGTFGFGGGDTVVTMNPDEDYFAGEVVRVSATGGISDTGGLPVAPYQWQFTAGPASGRCVAGFTDIGAGLTGVSLSSAVWGDYDSDGDLDILLAGSRGSSDISQVWRNNGGTFSDIYAGLPGVWFSSAAWGDYDNDGDLDILLTGDTGVYNPIAQVWQNDGGMFSQVTTSLPGVLQSSVAWGDYDNDGDLDILLAGNTGQNYFLTELWRNDGGTFNQVAISLPGVAGASVAWGDYDNDGNLDILLTGWTRTSGAISQVWWNNGGTFSKIADLTGVSGGSAAWGDYDNDGDLDILLTGNSSYSTTPIPTTQVWRNKGGTFSQATTNMPGVKDSSAAWGDYDNDGDLDILLTGEDSSSRISQVWRNDGGTFTDINAGLPGVYESSVAWGDYDNDGDLDILLTGSRGSSDISQVWRNDDCAPELNIVKRAEPETGVDYHGAVTYTVAMSNTGTLDAGGVLVTDTLPGEVEFARWVEQSGASESNGEITWTGAVSVDRTVTWTWVATHTGGFGEVTNTAWYRYPAGGTSGSAEATFSLGVQPTYLPLIYKGFVDLPDLVVTDLSATANEVRVTIENVGNKATVDDFWVDVYFDPRVQPPRINQPWERIAPYGVAWGVTDPVGPGESLELVTGDGYYWGPPDSSAPPYPTSASVWAYVDSVNWATTWGAVREVNEDNNTFGPVVSAAGDADAQPAFLEGRGEVGNLPAR